MNFLKKFLAFFSFIILFQLTSAQKYYSFFHNSENKYDTSKLSFELDNTNFLKNNEYFSNFAVGYTLIGYFIKPQMVYHPFSKLEINLGGYFLNYFGSIDKKIFVYPVFSIKYKPISLFSITFGSLQGTVNHCLPETIYDSETYITDNVENGLQFNLNSQKIKSQLWLDWQQFIFKNSNYPEKFCIGNYTNYNLLNLNSKKSLNIDIGGIISHIGGQIDTSGVAVQSIVNTISGINFKWNKFLTLYSIYHTSVDFSPQKQLPYLYGYAILSGIELNCYHLNFAFEHWFANCYFSSFGSPIYQSLSQVYKGYKENKRAIVISHIFWHNSNSKIINFGLGADLYFDLYNKTLDYSYSFYIKTNFNLILKK